MFSVAAAGALAALGLSGPIGHMGHWAPGLCVTGLMDPWPLGPCGPGPLDLVYRAVRFEDFVFGDFFWRRVPRRKILMF